ncbi:MAG: enoyl-ACP reductase FabI, partial [Pseudomonadota bacterium]
MFSLAGKKALVVGIANEQSIAWGCAKALKAQGADLAVTYLNDKAERFVRPLAEQLDASIIRRLDVTKEEELQGLFAALEDEWGRLDTVLHSIAYCPRDDLHGRVVDVSREGFLEAMDISVHSFIRMVRMSEPLMRQGGTCMTVSYQGATRVIENYNIMGPVKAALESVTRYWAADLGPKGISVHALSPGPLKTRAATGIADFDAILNSAAERAPTHHLATIDDVGAYC